MWVIIVVEAVLDATYAFRVVPCGHIPLITRWAKQKVTANVVEFQVAVGRRVADFEATWICVGDGAGHPGDLTIAILGVCGHHLCHGYV